MLQLDGVVLLASQSDGRYLGDPHFGVRGLAFFGGFDAPQRAAIERDSALALLPGLRTRLERA